MFSTLSRSLQLAQQEPVAMSKSFPEIELPLGTTRLVFESYPDGSSTPV